LKKRDRHFQKRLVIYKVWNDKKNKK